MTLPSVFVGPNIVLELITPEDDDGAEYDNDLLVLRCFS
jgi:hypothetical protein